MYIEKINQTAEIMQAVLSPGGIDGLLKEKEQTIKYLEECNVIKLPVIGVFNAGKTTLINSLIEEDGSLPVNIVPETAIPCEIYPVNDGELPHAEIFRGNQCIYKGSIDDYGKVTVEPGDFGKVYTSSTLIKDWSSKGIVLVDMPGYDSGIEEHNRAIGRYMNQGTVFAFLMNCTHGSMRASEISLLKEVCQYGIKIGVFLTHNDLLTPEKNQEVKDYVEYQIQSFLPKDTVIGNLAVLDGDNADFIDFVSNLDVSAIVSESAKPIVKSFIGQQIANLQGVIALAKSGKDQNTIDDEIRDLSEKIREMEAVIKTRLSEADTPEKSTQDVLDAARHAIKSNAGMLADAILQSRGDGTISSVTETLVSIIRPALAKAFKEEQDQFVSVLKADISALTRRILEGIDIPTDVLEDIIGKNEKAIVGYIHMIADFMQNHSHPVVRIIGEVLTFVAEYVPDFIRNYFGGNERVRAKLIENIQGPIADAIVSGLRRPVGEQIRALQAHILQATCAQYEASIKKMKETLAALHESQANDHQRIDEEILRYQEALNTIESIYNGI